MAYWNAHLRQWEDGEAPTVAGPIELYRPVDDGTEDLPADANVEVEFYAEYDSLEEAIDAIDCTGRWFWSRPDRGHYLGYLDSRPGSVGFVAY